MDTKSLNKWNFMTILLILSLLLFLYLIKAYIITMILAIIFTSILYPLYTKLAVKLKGKNSAAAGLITVMFLLIIIIPTFFLLLQIIEQGAQVAQKVAPVIENQLSQDSDASTTLPEWFPMRDQLEPYSAQIKAEMGKLVGKIGKLVVDGVGAFGKTTVNFIVSLFIMLFGVFFFLQSGPKLLDRLGQFIPMSNEEYRGLLSDLKNTSWATIKSAVVIGLIQGTLVGISFAVAGISQPVFWGAVAALASLIPSVGCALVYVPAGIYLLSTGQHWQGIFVLVWGFGIVGMVDNVLRPVLVGRGTKISELTILLSTLGGITAFGLPGVILGPMIASFLSSVSDLYLKDGNKL